MKNFICRFRFLREEPVYENLTFTKEYNKWFVCFRETIDGKMVSRNLDYCGMAGYKSWGKPEKKFHKHFFSHRPNMLSLDYYNMSDNDRREVIKRYPDFEYIFKKFHRYPMKWEMLNILRIYKDHPEMEILLNMKFDEIAKNKSFWKMDKAKQKAVIRYYLDNEGDEDQNYRRTFSLTYILGAMKLNVTPMEYREYMQNKTRNRWSDEEITIKKFLEIYKKKISVHDYLVYKRDLKRYFPNRLDDPYWTQFRNVNEFHAREQKVSEEISHIKFLENREKFKKQQRSYTRAIRKVKDWAGTFNGLEVYIPRKIDDIQLQAEKLNQCLIQCDYIQEVIDKNCLLIFIRKDGIPLATAELVGSKIEQFYGNELDRDNCDPSPECQKALDDFMHKFIAA